MTTIERSRNLILNKNYTKLNYEIACQSEDSENEIPYHAREHAKPFTYGNLPRDFKRSELNHVDIEELSECSKVELSKNLIFLSPKRPVKRGDFSNGRIDELPESSSSYKANTIMPPSPSLMRRTGRPSISPSRPVLKKTLSREEFEEMLKERRELSMREQNISLREAQNASIQKDLDELQEKLNKRSLQLKYYDASENSCREIVKHMETIDLPDEVDNNESNKRFASTDVLETVTNSSLIPVDTNRAETPAFPVSPKSSFEERSLSPYPMVQFNTKDTRRHSPVKVSSLIASKTQAKTFQSNVPETPQDVAPHLVNFARDSSEYWYKKHLTREEAVSILRQAPPGTFIIRNSTTYKNAFGLVLRVSNPPQGVTMPKKRLSSDVLVRHFLVEPTTRGVRLKGCTNEPTFTSLSALVYQHSISQMALPCKLLIPTRDIILSPEDAELMHNQRKLLEQGAACNVLFLFSMNVESLTGDEGIRRTVNEMYAQSHLPSPIEVHFKVSQSGITLTDNKRQMFFRRHYAPSNISYIAMDPDNHLFNISTNDSGLERISNKYIFAFIARPLKGGRDNQCHVFCDASPTQPAAAVVSFSQKVLHVSDKNNQQML